MWNRSTAFLMIVYISCNNQVVIKIDSRCTNKKLVPSIMINKIYDDVCSTPILKNRMKKNDFILVSDFLTG